MCSFQKLEYKIHTNRMILFDLFLSAANSRRENIQLHTIWMTSHFNVLRSTGLVVAQFLFSLKILFLILLSP